MNKPMDRASILPRNTDCMSRDYIVGTPALELSAWRFLAAHRVGGLAASHAQFIDSGSECRINTPSHDHYYESVGAPTWGDAAIKLAIALGMPWPSQCHAVQTVLGGDSNSAPTAIRPSGENAKTSPHTHAVPVASTTGATGAVQGIGESAGLAEAVSQIVSECRFRALEWRRAGNTEMAAAFDRVAAMVGVLGT